MHCGRAPCYALDMKETVEPWGILGALDREVALLREQMEITQTVTTLGTEFVFGRLHGQSVVVACCGVGKVNAAICATWMLLVAGCGCIINVGIAGAVGRGLRTLDVVASRELCFHDQDPVMLKYFPKRRFFEADAGLLERFRKACAEPGVVHGSVRVGRIATGDRFVADRATRDRIVADCAPDCVEMEGAAIAHAAFAAGKPFLVIRTMSDCADDDTESVYDDFLERAADQSARIVLAMLAQGTAEAKVGPTQRIEAMVRRGVPVVALGGLLLAAWAVAHVVPKRAPDIYERTVAGLSEQPAPAELMAAAEMGLGVRLTVADADAWRAMKVQGVAPERALRTVVDYRRALGRQ